MAVGQDDRVHAALDSSQFKQLVHDAAAKVGLNGIDSVDTLNPVFDPPLPTNRSLSDITFKQWRSTKPGQTAVAVHYSNINDRKRSELIKDVELAQKQATDAKQTLSEVTAKNLVFDDEFTQLEILLEKMAVDSAEAASKGSVAQRVGTLLAKLMQ